MMDHASDPLGTLKSHDASLAPRAMLGALAVTAGLTAYLAWPARRSNVATQKRQALIAYLRDQLSGSDMAIRVWRALQNLRPTPSTVHGMDFVELEANAIRQWEAIEERNRDLVARTFSATEFRPE